MRSLEDRSHGGHCCTSKATLRAWLAVIVRRGTEISCVLISSYQEGITGLILQRRKLGLREGSSVAQSQKTHQEQRCLVKDLSVDSMCYLFASWQEPRETRSGSTGIGLYETLGKCSLSRSVQETSHSSIPLRGAEGVTPIGSLLLEGSQSGSR